MKNDYNEAFKIIIGHEGGYQNLYNDRGNWTSGKIGVGERKGTKYGITAMSYPNLDIRNLTLDDAKAIYKRDYWDRVNADKLEPALALAAFDTAVNSGVGAAIKFLNKSKTVKDFLSHRRAYIRSLRLYGVLPSGSRSGKTYGQIWERRINELEKQAVTYAAKHRHAATERALEGAANNSAGVRVFLDTGDGFKELTDGKYDKEHLDVSVVGDKVYIRAYKD